MSKLSILSTGLKVSPFVYGVSKTGMTATKTSLTFSAILLILVFGKQIFNKTKESEMLSKTKTRKKLFNSSIKVGAMGGIIFMFNSFGNSLIDIAHNITPYASIIGLGYGVDVLDTMNKENPESNFNIVKHVEKFGGKDE